MELYADLQKRGIIAQATQEDSVRKLIDAGKAIFYIGFDATASSLHVGHLIQFIMINRLQSAGNKPIILLGTGTTLIGDPTGKTDMRKMLSKEEIDHNADCFLTQMGRYIDKDRATFVKNGDWLCTLGYLDLLKEVGTHFSVNRMLTADCVKTRLERGLSFLEFNYVVMQSYDFLHLNRHYGCNLQLGGDDQWSNIIGGVELVRRIEQKEAFGLTFTLLTTSDGKKMGKTEKGALWLDENKLPVYDFYQYWRNIEDPKVHECLKLLTAIPVEEIEASGQDINHYKERLAFEVTKIVHGEQAATTAMETAKAIFAGDMTTQEMPQLVLTLKDFNSAGELELQAALVKFGAAASKSDARRLIEQKAIKINNEEVNDPAHKLQLRSLKTGDLIVKKGKKVFFRLVLKD
jgi:tyrosyl-tRNA synthetase